MIEDLIVESKVVAGDDIDAGIFLDLPMLKSQSLAFLEEFFLRELVAPVGFGGFLELSVCSHARETED